MKKIALYSSSRPAQDGRKLPIDSAQRQDSQKAADESSSQTVSNSRRQRLRQLCQRYERILWVGAAGGLALLIVLTHAVFMPATREITQKDIDSAVLHTLETTTLPSPATKAYEVIRPSIVRVRRMEPDEKSGEDKEKGVGTGVVIVDKGVILTSLHVVAGAKRIQVVFYDGLESPATVTGMPISARSGLAMS